MMPGITFDFEKFKFTGIKLSQAELWQRVYPDIDIDDLIINKIPVWLDANPEKARKYKKWKRFLVNWFARDQKEIDMRRMEKHGNLFYQAGRSNRRINEIKENEKAESEGSKEGQ